MSHLAVSSFSLSQNTLLLGVQCFRIINFQLANSLKTVLSSVQAAFSTYMWQGHLHLNNCDIIWKHSYHLSSKTIHIIISHMQIYKIHLISVSHSSFSSVLIFILVAEGEKKDTEKEQKVKLGFFSLLQFISIYTFNDPFFNFINLLV